MSSIKHVCIYFTLILFVGGPGQALLLKIGISGPFNRIVLYYNVYTILHVTIPYQFIYFTILYNTILYTVRIQNTLFFPGCSCCSCLLLSVWLTTVKVKFLGGFSQKKNIKDCHLGQSLYTLVCRSGGDCKEFNFIFTFKKFNQQMRDQVMAFYLGG